MEIAYAAFLLHFFNIICGKWMPELTFSPNFDQYQFFNSSLFEKALNSSVSNHFPKNFQWQSVASVSLPFNKIAYIIYGGNQPTNIDSKYAFSKNSSTVVFCSLSFSENESNFNKIQCKKVETGEENWYLGVTIQALPISKQDAVIVYCDPLWHVSNTSEPKPSGKCYFNYINDGRIERNTSIEFCRLSSSSFLSCLGGFSIDLISTSKQLSDLQMVVGMPFLQPYGGVKILNDPFGSRTVINPRNGIGKYFNFGYAVSMATMSIAYASSPFSDHYGPNVTNLRQEIILTSPDNIPFSSFGLTLKTLSIADGTKHAVIIGAPFHSIKSLQNVGKTYVFCVTNGNTRSWLTKELKGEKEDEFFGYALENIGDINGDGNEDMAISSPFLRDDDGRGFVSIYTLSNDCEVKRKPQEILRSSISPTLGIFGLSLSGAVDLDFNSWPDIVILNSRSNSIELYASRTLFTAQCKYSIDNNYETEPLKKNENVRVRIFLSLLDRRKQNPIDLDFLNKFDLISQIDPNYDTTEMRFNLESNTTSLKLFSGSVAVSFVLETLMHAKDMNLTMPIIIAYRFIEDCSRKNCNNIKFPLIDWETCKVKIPVRKFICNTNPTCSADLSINIRDLEGNEIIYGYDKSFSRSLELSILNYGPTEGKDINFKISAHQNLRIHKIKAISEVKMKQIIIENQTEAICRLYQEEMDIYSPPIIIEIDIYFVDFKDTKKMKYRNNSILVELFSDVHDSNFSNNKASVNYTFVYEPNVTFSGSPSKDTVVDSRNRSQLIRPGQRLAIDSIGPRLSQKYVIENFGNATITDMIIKVKIPMVSKNGHRILYLFDKIRGVNKSEAVWMSISPQITIGPNKYLCNLPVEYVNPLHIIGFETHELHLSNIDIQQISDGSRVIKRRSVETQDKTQSSSAKDNIKITQGKMHRIPVEIVQCDRVGVNLKSPICAEVYCKIPILPPKKQARLQINAWLWAHTFFKKQISDIMVYTTLQTDFSDIPEGVKLKWETGKSYSQSQQFIFQNVKPKITHFKPWWPIVVGIVIGILILAILIVALYKCGFFQRNKIRRHFSRKSKKSVHRHVILHPGELHTVSSGSSETKFTSHSALIK